jgi:hypothetical protein
MGQLDPGRATARGHALELAVASIAPAPLGQSSAENVKTGSTSPAESASEASGTHGVAHSPFRPATGPGNSRSPSPARRSGPQPKHVGKGWRTSQGQAAAAASASARGHRIGNVEV